jgi:hypothetical protein
VHLDKALGHDSLVVSICVIQIVECVANTGIAKLRLHNHGNSSIRSHQDEHLGSVLLPVWCYPLRSCQRVSSQFAGAVDHLLILSFYNTDSSSEP